MKGKALKEIYAILTETLACFLPGRAKDLSAPLYISFIRYVVILASPVNYISSLGDVLTVISYRCSIATVPKIEI